MKSTTSTSMKSTTSTTMSTSATTAISISTASHQTSTTRLMSVPVLLEDPASTTRILKQNRRKSTIGDLLVMVGSPLNQRVPTPPSQGDHLQLPRKRVFCRRHCLVRPQHESWNPLWHHSPSCLLPPATAARRANFPPHV